MVEIFRTNVNSPERADLLLLELQERFPGYKMNFDLEDCDKILRVEAIEAPINPAEIIWLLARSGYHSEVLPDTVVT